MESKLIIIINIDITHKLLHINKINEQHQWNAKSRNGKFDFKKWILSCIQLIT